MGEYFFWYRLTQVVPDKIHRAIKRLCVCGAIDPTASTAAHSSFTEVPSTGQQICILDYTDKTRLTVHTSVPNFTLISIYCHCCGVKTACHYNIAILTEFFVGLLRPSPFTYLGQIWHATVDQWSTFTSKNSSGSVYCVDPVRQKKHQNIAISTKCSHFGGLLCSSLLLFLAKMVPDCRPIVFAYVPNLI